MLLRRLPLPDVAVRGGVGLAPPSPLGGIGSGISPLYGLLLGYSNQRDGAGRRGDWSMGVMNDFGWRRLPDNGGSLDQIQHCVPALSSVLVSLIIRL